MSPKSLTIIFQGMPSSALAYDGETNEILADIKQVDLSLIDQQKHLYTARLVIELEEQGGAIQAKGILQKTCSDADIERIALQVEKRLLQRMQLR